MWKQRNQTVNHTVTQKSKNESANHFNQQVCHMVASSVWTCHP
jgi:hypothetical protein